MKARFILVLLPLLCFSQISRPQLLINPTAVSDGLKGKVKQVKKDCHYPIKEGDKVITGAINFISLKNILVRYDSSGRWIDKCLYLAGNAEMRYYYKYDDKGHVLEENIRSSDKTGSYRNTYKYNNKGNLIENLQYDDKGKLEAKRAYRYNEKGFLSEYLFYDQDGIIMGRSTFKSNDKGEIIEELSYFDQDLYNGKTLCTYNDSGKLIEENSYDQTGELLSNTQHKYDDMGNEIEMVDQKYSYNETQRKKFEYEYDSQGNWIKMVSYYDDKPVYYQLRTIEYYER
jgi:hypothetical protein